MAFARLRAERDRGHPAEARHDRRCGDRSAAALHESSLTGGSCDCLRLLQQGCATAAKFLPTPGNGLAKP